MSNKNRAIKAFKKFGKNNKVLLAVIGGAAAGIAISRIFGTEKAGAILKTLQKNITDFGSKLRNGAHAQESPGQVYN